MILCRRTRHHNKHGGVRGGRLQHGVEVVSVGTHSWDGRPGRRCCIYCMSANNVRGGGQAWCSPSIIRSIVVAALDKSYAGQLGALCTSAAPNVYCVIAAFDKEHNTKEAGALACLWGLLAVCVVSDVGLVLCIIVIVVLCSIIAGSTNNLLRTRKLVARSLLKVPGGLGSTCRSTRV